jgi:hypothetical protein
MKQKERLLDLDLFGLQTRLNRNRKGVNSTMKKIVSAAFIMAALVLMTGCYENKSEAPKAPAAPAAPATSAPAAPATSAPASAPAAATAK